MPGYVAERVRICVACGAHRHERLAPVPAQPRRRPYPAYRPGPLKPWTTLSWLGAVLLAVALMVTPGSGARRLSFADFQRTHPPIKGGASITAAAGGGNWSATGTWVGGVVPGSGDDVILASTSGSVTVDVNSACRSLDCMGSGNYAGVLTNTNGLTLSIGTSTSTGLSLRFSPSMTYTVTGTNASIAFVGTSGTQETINFSGQPVGGYLKFTGVGGSWIFNDSCVQNAAANASNGWVTHTDGTLNTNGQSCTWLRYVTSGASTRALTLGGSTVTLYANTGSPWSIAASGLTTSLSSSTLIMTGNGGTAMTFAGANLTGYGILSVTGNTPLTMNGANTFLSWLVSPQATIIGTSGQTVTVINPVSWYGRQNGYFATPGIVSNFASTPDASPLDITGSITIDVKLALASWVPSANGALVGKWNASGSFSYLVYIDTTGKINFQWSSNGTATTTVSSSVLGFAAGSVNWIRISYNSGTGAYGWYKSSDGATWTLINGSTSSATAIFNSTSLLTIGASGNTGGSNPLAASFYEVKVYNSALTSSAGTPVFDANFAAKTLGSNTFTESSANAATVTINGTTAQAGDGRISVSASTGGSAWTLKCASGAVACNYMVLRDSTATGGAVFYAGSQTVNVSGNTGWTFSTDPGGAPVRVVNQAVARASVR